MADRASILTTLATLQLNFILRVADCIAEKCRVDLYSFSPIQSNRYCVHVPQTRNISLFLFTPRFKSSFKLVGSLVFVH